jgi:tRNA pseudouridine55 synthase
MSVNKIMTHPETDIEPLASGTDSYDGIILMDKDAGRASFEVVKDVRRILKVRKVGHAGTLDPFATGLLVILLGQGTKLFPFLMSGKKSYRATLRLGVETESHDPTGRVVQTRPVPKLEPRYIKEKVSEFIGEIEQTPPIFSAVKYRGERAYKLARKGVKIEIEKRRVKIYDLKVTSLDLPEVTVEIFCSSGTYIRSLAADLGEKLGTVAHVKTLRRLSSGPFRVKDALNPIGILTPGSRHLIIDKIIPLREALPDMGEIQIDVKMALKIRHGYQPGYDEVFSSADSYEGYMKLVKDKELVAIINACHHQSEGRGRLKIVRVFI